MPALHTKDEQIQEELIRVLKALTCMTFGNYSLTITDSKMKEYGYLLFANTSVRISVVCNECHIASKKQTKKEIEANNCNESIEIYAENNTPTPSQNKNNNTSTLFTSFLNWSRYTDAKKCGFWDLFRTYCNHFYVDCGVVNDIIKIENTAQIIKGYKFFICREMVRF